MGLLTALTSVDDGRLLIETQDYRTEFAFEDFCADVSQALGVSLRPVVGSDALAPRAFSFEGEAFAAAWEDDFGCHIVGRETQRAVIERMNAKLG